MGEWNYTLTVRIKGRTEFEAVEDFEDILDKIDKRYAWNVNGIRRVK